MVPTDSTALMLKLFERRVERQHQTPKEHQRLAAKKQRRANFKEQEEQRRADNQEFLLIMQETKADCTPATTRPSVERSPPVKSTPRASPGSPKIGPCGQGSIR